MSTKTKLLEQYSKELNGVSFTVAIISGKATVRLGKKYVVCRCPDKDSAALLSEVLTTAARTQQEKIDQVLSLLAVRCQQLELSLFSKDGHDAFKGNGDQPEGRVSDPVEALGGGPQKSA